MLDPSVVLYARERWRVIRVDGGEQQPTFVVVDSAGTELRHEADFDDARAWIDRRASDCHTHARALLRARSR